MASPSPSGTPPRSPARAPRPGILKIDNRQGKNVSFRRPSTPSNASSPPARPFSRQNRPTSQGSNRLKETYNHEQTPLLSGGREETETLASGMSAYSGDYDDEEDDSEETKSTAYLILLTMAIGGYVRHKNCGIGIGTDMDAQLANCLVR